MPTLRYGFEFGIFLPALAVFSLQTAAENRSASGTPINVEHYVGRAGPDPGYVNLPPSTVGIGGPLISPKKATWIAPRGLLRLIPNAGRP
jgi:hypothetical protein